jgi:hemerythrin-like domain-containing protein
MDALEKEHKRAEQLHAEVDRLGAKYLEYGSLPTDQIAAFRDSVSELSAIYQGHIRLEDEVLFRIAAEVLRESDKRAVAEEMAARRQLRSGV